MEKEKECKKLPDRRNSTGSSNSSSCRKNLPRRDTDKTYLKKEKSKKETPGSNKPSTGPRSELPKKIALHVKKREKEKTSVPVTINRKVITNPKLISLLNDSSNSETSDGSINNSQQSSKEKRKLSQLQEPEKPRKRTSGLEKGERVETNKTLLEENAMPKLTNEKSVEGKNQPSSVEINRNPRERRNKVGSRDCIDSGKYSEILSPDSTEGDFRKLKDTEILEPVNPVIVSSKSKGATPKKMDKIQKIPGNKTAKDNKNIHRKGSSNFHDNSAGKRSSNETSVFPDSSTCISDDEAIEHDLRAIFHSPPKGSEERVIELERNTPGPSEDVLSKAGILRDEEKNLYEFSKDKIFALVDIITDEIPENPQESIENCPDIPSEPSNDDSTDDEPQDTEPVKLIDHQDENSSDVEILEIIPMQPVSDSEAENIPVEDKEPENEPLESPLQESPTFPRLRVKTLNELNFQSRLAAPYFPPLETTSEHSIPPQDFSAPSTSSFIPGPFPSAESRVPEQQSARAQQLMNPSADGAKRFLELMKNSSPSAMTSFNTLINILRDISHDTNNFRNFYLNNPLGIDSPEMTSFKASLKRKLLLLTEILQVNFDLNTIQSILSNYSALTAEPTLNVQELFNVMNFHSEMVLFPQVGPSHGFPPPNQVAPQQMQPIRHSVPIQNQFIPPQLFLPPPVPPVPIPSHLQQERSPRSRTNRTRQKDVFTPKQRLDLKRQIDAHNILVIRLNELVQEQQRATERRVSIRENRVESNSSTSPSEMTEPNIVLKIKNTSTGFQIHGIANNLNKRGLVITPVKNPSTRPAIFEPEVSQPYSKESGGRSKDLPPFPSNLSITAILPTTATPTVPTMSASVSNSSLRDECTITVVSSASGPQSISSIKQTSTIAPSVIVSPQIQPQLYPPVVSSQFNPNLPRIPFFPYNHPPMRALQPNPNVFTQYQNVLPTSGSASGSRSGIPPLRVPPSVIVYQPSVTATANTTVNKYNNQFATSSGTQRTGLPLKTKISGSNPSHLYKRKKIPRSSARVEETRVNPPDVVDNSALADPDLVNEFRSMPVLEYKGPALYSGSSKGESSKNTRREDSNDQDKREFPCFQCHKRSTMFCTNCNKVTYCSQLCKDIHWKRIHQKDCRVRSSIDTQKARETKDK